MDLTEILSNIFVSRKTKKENKTVCKHQEIDTKSQTNNNNNNTDEKSKQINSQESYSDISEKSYEKSESEKSYEKSKSEKSYEKSKSEKSYEKNKSEKSYEKSEHIEKYNLKKLILKASEFYKKNIFIINSDETNNLKILADLLEKLNNMKDVFEIYDKNITIYTFTDNKKNYKMMSLENPYLNFEFNFKNVLKNIKFKDNDETKDKRHLVILDFNLISDLDKLLDENLLSDNIHLIVLFNNYSLAPALLNLYKFNENALIINKKDLLKSVQKKFYSKVVKKIIKDPLVDKDYYSQFLIDENLDIKNIIIKNGELRYN